MEISNIDFLSSQFLPFIVFALIVYILSAILRKLVEIIHPKILNKELVRAKVWRELLLPVTPILIGSILALEITSFPHPTEFRNVWVGRMMYGALLGFFSSWAYRVVKSVAKRKWQVELPDFEAPRTTRSLGTRRSEEDATWMR